MYSSLYSVLFKFTKMSLQHRFQMLEFSIFSGSILISKDPKELLLKLL